MVVRRLALGAVIVAATVLSYSTLRERALHIGLPEWSSWFYPLVFDAFILGASRTWQNSELSKSTRILAMVGTFGGVCAAVSAFVAEFWNQGWSAVAFAVAIPVVLALALTITTKAAHDRAAPSPTPEPQRSAETISEPAPVKQPRVPLTKKPKRVPPSKEVSSFADRVVSTEERRAWIRDQLAMGVDVTGAMVDRQFGGPRNGARLVRAVRDAS
jgi:hypothetical protein